MRETLVLLFLQPLHSIIQEEINENRIDPVCPPGLGLFSILSCFSFVWLFLLGLGDAGPSSRLDLRVTLFNLALDQLDAPDASTAHFDFPF